MSKVTIGYFKGKGEHNSLKAPERIKRIVL